MLNWAVVVDDDLLNLKAAERILSVHGYRVTRLHSGEELLEFVKENTPDIILLDLHMSGIDGFETIRRLRGSECSQNIPVIVLTADRDEDNEVRALSAGAMDFVGKPFTPSVLLMRVRNTIDLMHLQTDLKEEVTRITERMRREHDRNERLSLQIVQTLAGTIDAKDSYTRGHSSRVAEYAQKIAARAGYSPRMQEEMYMMGLLHDVGKIGVPDTVINKPSRLTAEEYELIKMHPSVGFEILKNITEMPKLAIGARWHHERYDGTGYPDGIAGTEIPEEARIIAIADAYDAMSSRRSYHEVLPQKYIISELEKGKGTQFDPDFADIMLSMIRDDRQYTMREHTETVKQEEQSINRADLDGKIFSIFTMLEAGGFHTAHGMKFCMDDPEMYVDLLGEFVNSAKSRVDKLRTAFQAEDWTQYRIAVHSLKSAAKTIGADRLGQLSEALEKAAAEGQADYIHTHHRELIGSIRIAENSILTALGPHDE